jgi:hypothetical protein
LRRDGTVQPRRCWSTEERVVLTALPEISGVRVRRTPEILSFLGETTMLRTIPRGRFISACLTAVMLPTVAGAAVTFTSAWTEFLNKQVGGASAPVVSSADGADSTELTVDMGTGMAGDRSYIGLRRDFTIGPDGQRVELRHMFQSTLENRGAVSGRVQVRPIRIRGQRTESLTSGRFSAGVGATGVPNVRFVDHDSTKVVTLRPGTYRVEFRLVYSAPTNTGTWDNSSPHKLTLTGL